MEIMDGKNDKLNGFMAGFEAGFGPGFNEKVMNKITNIEHVLQVEAEWTLGMKRILIPAAAVLIFFISYNLINFKTLSPEVTNGSSILEQNSSTLLSISNLE